MSPSCCWCARGEQATQDRLHGSPGDRSEGLDVASLGYLLAELTAVAGADRI
jgi:hypothetical protein